LSSVLAVLYLIFNEGYSATAGSTLVRRELTNEAIRLTRVLVTLMPSEPEAAGLLALLLLQDSRRDARQTQEGELILLRDQDRSRWDTARITEGLGVLERASFLGPPGPYQLQAAIAGEHARAATADATDWPRIVRLYDLLFATMPSPVVALNRAVAVSMASGPERGLAIVDGLSGSGDLDGYHLLHSTRGELLTRVGRAQEARTEFARALELATNDVDRRHLEKRLSEIGRPN
jgi:RNA polymerase sigma-70 factor (ECF subfamily)